MIDGRQDDGAESGGTVALGVDRQIAGGEHTTIVIAIDEAMQRIAVGADGRGLVDAEFIFQPLRFAHAGRAPAHGMVISRLDVVHFEGNVLHAVAVLAQAFAVGMLITQWRR